MTNKNIEMMKKKLLKKRKIRVQIKRVCKGQKNP